ncbi:MAG: hypothetical protein H6R26_1446, partial [Proteobacteria bacterium]|nr:hypothetical protein [Pseudomonadota bacterium]
MTHKTSFPEHSTDWSELDVLVL